MKGEINLLPRVIILKRERKAYLAGIGRLLQRLSFLLIVLIVGEVIVYIAFSYINKELIRASEIQSAGNSITNEVKRVNEVLARVETIKSEYINWSLFVEEIIKNAPLGIKIVKMQVKEGEGVLKVEGFSSSRSSVLDFQNLLKELSWVIRVEAPLQNYALGTDTSFSFNLVVIEVEEE